MKALVVLTLFSAGLIWTTEAALRRVCYHTNWSQYRPSPAKFTPGNIDPNLCTHLIYAFATLQGNNLHPFEWNDDTTSWKKGLYEEFTDLKKANPALKTILAVGGWNMGSSKFTAMVNSDSSRQQFVTSTIQYLRQRNFDGLDLDWEYPGSRGSPAGDKQKFVTLLKELHEGFVREAATSGKPRLILSAAVPAGKSNIDAGYDIPQVSRYLDLINLMTYDLHGTWEDHTGMNSPLFRRKDETGDDVYLNVDWAAQHWATKGAPKEKLNIGMPLYGHAFTLQDTGAIAPGEGKASKGQAGRYTREAGFLAYYEICEMLKSGGKRYWDSEGLSPYVVKGNQWVAYDDPESLKYKVDYVKKNNFGGVMVWALPLDDFGGLCDGHTKFPLMQSIISALGSSSPIVLPTQAPLPTERTTRAPTVGGAITTQSPISQTITCTGRENGFYSDARSCNAYFICASGMKFAVSCKDGLLFDDTRKTCVYNHLVQCGGRPVGHVVQTGTPIPTIPTQRPWTSAPTQPSTGNQGSDHFCSNKADGLHADPQNCLRFYNCASRLTFHEKCPPGTAWDSTNQACNFRYKVPNC